MFYCVKIVRARARPREKHSFFVPASQFSVGSSLHWLSLHINVMRTKGPKQLVHDAIDATLVLFFYALRISHAFRDVRVLQAFTVPHWLDACTTFTNIYGSVKYPT